MDAHEVLVAARNLIDRDGWWDESSWTGRHCASNAIHRLDISPAEYNEAAGYFLLAAGLSAGADWGRAPLIFRWNDTPGRTEAEVLAVFDAAIAATAPEPVDPLQAKPLAEFPGGGQHPKRTLVQTPERSVSDV